MQFEMFSQFNYVQANMASVNEQFSCTRFSSDSTVALALKIMVTYLVMLMHMLCFQYTNFQRIEGKMKSGSRLPASYPRAIDCTISNTNRKLLFMGSPMINQRQERNTKRHADMVRNNKQGRLGWMGKQESQRRAMSVLGHRARSTKHRQINYDVATKSLLLV